MEHIEPDVRPFFCLPFTYSDVLIGHDVAVAPMQGWDSPALAHAEDHRDIPVKGLDAGL